MSEFYAVTLVATALVFLAAFSSLIAFRFGAPLLLLFLTIGLGAGVDGLGIELGDSMIDAGQDPAEIKNRVKAYLTANPDTQAVLTLGPTSADPTIQALQEMGTAGSLYFGTFDLGTEIVKAIKDGTIKWGIDQQPFLQGYIPILNICLTKKYGFSGLDINTAGAFVDSTNVDAGWCPPSLRGR